MYYHYFYYSTTETCTEGELIQFQIETMQTDLSALILGC